jgi:hypothetical protein
MPKFIHGYASKKPTNPFRKTYCVWNGMRRRCLSTEHKDFPYYGGRGITICDRWSRFENFLADMGKKPDGMSIDRIDNDGNYEPGNCRWTTHSRQIRNSRHAHMVTHDGETLCIADWAERTGVTPANIRMRMKRGWSVARALGFD